MKYRTCFLQSLSVGFLLLSAVVVRAELHRATHLGNPSTRFADPLHTPEDLRERFRDQALWPDMAAILRQAGWDGELDDLLQAARTAELAEIQIQPGTVMPFMSSRKGGRPVTLKEVLWAGKEPTPAYAFFFSSKGRRYRCVTPKACSNFFVEDLGAPQLLLQCDAPEEVLAGRPALLCLTVRNQGDGEEPSPVLEILLPPDATLTRIAKGGVVQADRVSWQLDRLPPGKAATVCAELLRNEPGSIPAAWTAKGSVAATVNSQCKTRVVGIPAILLEVVDLSDPIEIGSEVTYRVTVLNQGSAPATRIRIVVTLPKSQSFVAASGSTPGSGAGPTVTLEPLATLAPGAEAHWDITVKALAAGDERFQVDLLSDQLDRPVQETESTHQY